jgi:hypothetical protein
LLDQAFPNAEIVALAATNQRRAIAFMKKYIADWDADLAKSKTPAEMAFFPDANKGK